VKIIVMGTGGVGGYFGARLAAAGLEVWFVARGRNLTALRERGLVVRTPTGDVALPAVRAVEWPADAGRGDLILVCVKTYDTEAAAAALRPAVGPDTIVLSLQNGIENEEVLAHVLGLPPLLLALTQIGAELVGPGEVRYYSRGTIVFGEPDGSESPRARSVAALFERAAVPYRLSRRIRIRVWDKLAWNAGFNAVTALTRQTVAGAMAHPGSRAVVAAAMAEVAAVANAQGIGCDPARIEAVLEESRSGLADFKTSMLQDLERGRRLEHDALNGAVLRAADRCGVAVPVNRTLWGLLARLDPAADA
jgi:2-dehydropantoate 2-reductase